MLRVSEGELMMPTQLVARPQTLDQAWPRRLRILAAVALLLAIAGPAVAAMEGWEIDAASLLGTLTSPLTPG